ncbi:MAG: transporter substrate-binding domain-containing protein [Vampirovibrionales bacterium]|nr:transporter substrate-binding domain-containing protein [Vampirovibrionales bacterium]
MSAPKKRQWLLIILIGVAIALLALSFRSCRGALPNLNAPMLGKTGEGTLLAKIYRSGRLVAGVKFDARPFGYLDTDGQIKGYDIDLIREIARRLTRTLKRRTPIQPEFQQVLSSTRIIGLNLGKLDLVAATMTITPERETLIDFTDPYYMARQAVITPVSSPARSIRDLDRATIFYVIGATSERNIRLALPHARFKGFKSAVEAFTALRGHRAEAFTSDDTILYGLMEDGCDFRLLPERLSQEPYGLGIRQDLDSHETESFRLAINQILKDMREDGTLERLRQKWMGPYEAPHHCNPPAQGKPGASVQAGPSG